MGVTYLSIGFLFRVLNQRFVKLSISPKADFAVKTSWKHCQSSGLHLSLLLSVYPICSPVNQNHLLWTDLMPAEINKLRAHDAILRHKWKDTTYGSQFLVNHNISACSVQMFAGPQICQTPLGVPHCQTEKSKHYEKCYSHMPVTMMKPDKAKNTELPSKFS